MLNVVVRFRNPLMNALIVTIPLHGSGVVGAMRGGLPATLSA
jgi:hypothetical protein